MGKAPRLTRAPTARGCFTTDLRVEGKSLGVTTWVIFWGELLYQKRAACNVFTFVKLPATGISYSPNTDARMIHCEPAAFYNTESFTPLAQDLTARSILARSLRSTPQWRDDAQGPPVGFRSRCTASHQGILLPGMRE